MNDQSDTIEQRQDLGGETNRGIAQIGLPARSDSAVETVQRVRVSLGQVSPRDTNEWTTPNMFDATLAERLTIEIVSSLDQPADVQIIGSTDNTPEETTRHYPLGNPLTLPANGRAGATINLNDAWFPFIGVTITPISSPTTGQVATTASAQRRVERGT